MDTGKRKQNDPPSNDSDTAAGGLEESQARKKAKPNAYKPDSDAADSSLATPNLHTLLDFSSLHDESAISQRFDEIARILMHEYHLVVIHAGVETAFEIQELEFYLQKGGCHEDPFTHGSEEQKVSGRWLWVAFTPYVLHRYFHRAPRRSEDASRSATSLTGYRGGSRKGLDLTIGGPLPRTVSPYFGQTSRSSAASDTLEQESRSQGDEDRLLRGGILLRSLRGISALTNAVGNNNPKSLSVSGPSLLVDKILELSGAPSIAELVEKTWGGDTTALNPPLPSSSRSSYLYLKHVAGPPSELPQIHKSPRIGLDLSHPGTTVPATQSTLMDLHPRVRFLSKSYRYFTRPDELTKGRPQTLYGLVQATLDNHSQFHHCSLSGDKAFRNILVASLRIKDASITKYLAEYEAGKKAGLAHLKSCIGPKGKGSADSPTSYLKMMGSLEAVLDSPRGEEIIETAI